MATSPVFLSGESPGQRSLVGYSPWGHREMDMTERLTQTHTHGHGAWRLTFQHGMFRLPAPPYPEFLLHVHFCAFSPLLGTQTSDAKRQDGGVGGGALPSP